MMSESGVRSQGGMESKVRRYLKGGYRFRTKRIKGKAYLYAIKGKEDRSMGPYEQANSYLQSLLSGKDTRPEHRRASVKSMPSAVAQILEKRTQ